MSLRVRLNFLITLLFISLFIFSSFYIIANSRDAVHREVQSTANLALQLIQIANTSASVNEESQLLLLQKLSELDKTRHLHIELSNPTEILENFHPDGGQRDKHFDHVGSQEQDRKWAVQSHERSFGSS